MYEPGGSLMGMGYSSIEGSLFNTYLLPGLILFVIIGIGGLLVALLTYKKAKNYAWYIIYFGVMLIVLILALLTSLETYSFVLVIYILLAVLLIFLGNFIRNQLHTLHLPKHEPPFHSTVKRPPHGTHRHRRK